jgi:hypothetical protein
VLRFARCLVVAATCFIAGTLQPRSAAATDLTLRWTATGDDGLIGTASQYDLRYAFVPLTAQNFTSAIVVTGLPVPRPAGTSESFTVRGLPDGVLMYFGLRARDDAGNWSAISNVVTLPGQTVDVENGPFAIGFSLPMPNPARIATRFALTLPEAAEVRVEAFDLAGRRVRVLAAGPHAAGTFDVVWDLRGESGARVEPGVYLVRANAGANTWTRRVAVVK